MVFLFVFLIVVLLILTLVFRIEIKEIDLVLPKQENHIVSPGYQLVIRFLLFGLLPIGRIVIDATKLKKFNLKEKVEEFEKKAWHFKDKIDVSGIHDFRNLQVEIKKFVLQVELGTENAAFTALIIPFASTAMSCWFQRIQNKNPKKQKERDLWFHMKPLYLNQNVIKVHLEGIFELHMMHIIYTIYVLKKKRRVKKHERSSNRGAYDYGYE